MHAAATAVGGCLARLSRLSSAILVTALACSVLAGCGRDRTPPPAPGAVDETPARPVRPRPYPLPESPDALAFRVPLAAARVRARDVGGDSLARVRARERAGLVVNAGFFDPAFEPEGLVVSDGVLLSSHLERLSGGVLWIRSGHGALAMTEGFVLPPGVEFAVQCRPRLVVGGAVNIASETGRRAARTALCLRQAGTVLDVIVAPATVGAGPTLLELARALAADGCDDALNLDGGPSTGAAWWAEDGAHALEPPGPVRQAIVLSLAE